MPDKIYDLKVVAQKIREQLKNEFPNCVFSVTKDNHSIDIRLMKADFNPFSEGSDNKYLSVNHYNIDTGEGLSEKGKKVMLRAKEISDEYNWDKSDPMTDYFNVNFYLHMSIGKWDKPFEQTAPEKTEPVPVPKANSSTTTNPRAKWDYGKPVHKCNGWTLFTKTLGDGRTVNSLVKDAETLPNKVQWNEIRGEVMEETGFIWSPKGRAFQKWGTLDDLENRIETICAVMGKYYTGTSLPVPIQEQQQVIQEEPMEGEVFNVDESYKSIPDNPKLEYVTIKWSEGFEYYTSLYPRTFKSFKQATKFIADNLKDLEEGAYDKHGIEFKFINDENPHSDRWDINSSDDNPNVYPNMWAKEILQGMFFNAFQGNLSEDYDAMVELGKEGIELTNNEFYDIVNTFCGLTYYNEKMFPLYTTQATRNTRLREAYPKLFELFSTEPKKEMTQEQIRKKIKVLTILAEDGDEVAKKKLKILELLLN